MKPAHDPNSLTMTCSIHCIIMQNIKLHSSKCLVAQFLSFSKLVSLYI